MTQLEAMKKRVSRRHYTGPLPQDVAAEIRVKALDLSLDNGLEIRLVENQPTLFGGISTSYGMFKGVHSFLVLAGLKNDPFLFEKAGHAGEELVLLATQLSQGSCWVGGTFDRESVSALLVPGTKLVAVITLGPTDAALHSREKFVRRVTHLRKHGANWHSQDAGEPPHWFRAGAQAAALAPSARNAQPVHFVYKDQKASVSIPDDSPYQHTDLGIAKLHFELAAGGGFPLGTPATFTRFSP